LSFSRDDLPACGLGYETVNEAAGRECCLNPSSSYLGFVARLPNPKYGNKMATKRYWCGAQLGRTGQISSSTEPYVIKVLNLFAFCGSLNCYFSCHSSGIVLDVHAILKLHA